MGLSLSLFFLCSPLGLLLYMAGHCNIRSCVDLRTKTVLADNDPNPQPNSIPLLPEGTGAVTLGGILSAMRNQGKSYQDLKEERILVRCSRDERRRPIRLFVFAWTVRLGVSSIRPHGQLPSPPTNQTNPFYARTRRSPARARRAAVWPPCSCRDLWSRA